MDDRLGPATLRVLASTLRGTAADSQVGPLLAHADAWEAERVIQANLAEELTNSQKKVEVLEQDRKWWQENAIRRLKRSAARRSGPGG